MGPERLTQLCVDAIALTGSGDDYRCPGCSAKMTAPGISPHAMQCAALREQVVTKAEDGDGVRVAYGLPDHLIVRIVPLDGVVGLFVEDERLVVVQPNITNATALSIVRAILGAFERGKKVGGSERGKAVLDLLNS